MIIKNTFVLFLLAIGLLSCDTSSKTNIDRDHSAPASLAEIYRPGIISQTGRMEHGISFSTDNTKMIFGILNKKDCGKILHSNRIDGHWTDPKPFDPIGSNCVYLPYFTPDGSSIVYSKSSDDNINYITDIWILGKSPDKWNNARKLESPISSISREACASMTLDGSIYFSSNRNCEGIEQCYTADLFYSKKVDGAYQDPELISELSSFNDEESVFISPNEDYILFCRYSNDSAGTDLFISYRNITGKWLEPIILDSSINSTMWDRRPFVSSDNKTLYFTRLEVDETGLLESDIYWVNTKKVFKPFVYNPIVEIRAKQGEQMEYSFPKDYFKDIDDELVRIELLDNHLDWLQYDSNSQILKGVLTETGRFELIFRAEDQQSNMSLDTLTLIVQE